MSTTVILRILHLYGHKYFSLDFIFVYFLFLFYFLFGLQFIVFLSARIMTGATCLRCLREGEREKASERERRPKTGHCPYYLLM